MAITVASGKHRTSSPKPGRFARLFRTQGAEAFDVADEAEPFLPPQPEPAPRPARPVPQVRPTHIGDPDVLHIRPVHPDDLVRRLAHIALDLAGRAELDSRAVYRHLQPLYAELAERCRAEDALERRSGRNRADAEQMARGLEAAASTPGVSIDTVTDPQSGREHVPAMTAQIVGRARQASDPTDTAPMTPITENTPDPRLASALSPVRGPQMPPPVPPRTPDAPQATSPAFSKPSAPMLSAIPGDHLPAADLTESDSVLREREGDDEHHMEWERVVAVAQLGDTVMVEFQGGETVDYPAGQSVLVRRGQVVTAVAA